ncbi:MAG: peptidylprolyl isomerase [Pseudomonadota bacterium]|nr:peptidylprolyl isomerase [Pseudomonadota bacterium]
MLNKCLIIGCLLLASAATAKSTPQHTVPLDRVVAVVNSSVISQSELDLAVKAAKQQMTMTHQPLPSNTALRQQALDRLIYDTLVLQIAKRNNLTVTDAELDTAIENMAKSNHMDVDQLKFAVQNDGIKYDAFRKRIYNQMLIARVQQGAVSPKVSVTESDVSSYIKSETNKKLGSGEYHLLHVYVALPDAPSSEAVNAAKAKAQSLYNKIKGGESFEKIAMNSSTGAEALAGGDLGWRKAAEVPTIFSKPLASMKVGDISKPVQAPNGFHIVKLVEARNDSTKLSQQDVKNQLFRRKFDEHLQVWLKQLRDTAFVKVTL